MFRQILFPGQVVFGHGSTSELSSVLTQLEIHSPLVLIDSGIPTDTVDCLIGQNLVGIPFHQISVPPGEPTTDRADQFTQELIKLKCDGIVAVGGGSTMDLGKAISVLIRERGSAKQYQGAGLVTGQGLPVVCIPTTAGSGAEATKSAVLTDLDSQIKRGINAVGVLPDAAILDSRFLLDLPYKPRIASLLDATAHAVESFIGKNSWELSEAFSNLAFPHLGKHLKLGAEPLDIETADSAILGSFYGGAAICNAETGAVHALAYPLTEYHNIPHGYGVGAFLGHVLEFEKESISKKISYIAAQMGFESSDSLITCLNKLAETLDLSEQILELLNDPQKRSKLRDRTLTLTGAIENSPQPWDSEKIDDFYNFFVANN